MRFVSSSKFALNRAPKLFLIFSSTVWKARRPDAALVALFLMTALSSGCISAHRTPNLENIFAESRAQNRKTAGDRDPRNSGVGVDQFEDW